MTYVTEILDQEPGIQYQGVKDKTGGTGTYPIVGLIMGQFKRGRFDKPMIINNDNIKAMLGYDPKNPSYVAVQDALSQGLSSVQVLRLKDAADVTDTNGPSKVCTGATAGIILSRISDGGYYSVTINDNKFDGVIGFKDGRVNLKSVFAQFGIIVTPLNEAGQEILSTGGAYNGVAKASFYNPTGNHVNCEISVVDASSLSSYIIMPEYGENKTVVITANNGGTAKFCLE